MHRYHRLTPSEQAIIQDKQTERPWSGAYNRFDSEGVYLCRRCDAPLFMSLDKFDSECGWPSFDGEIAHAVERVLDADGRRTEILCNRCKGHLGHVFTGEGLTANNLRHCVNSISLAFMGLTTEEGFERAYFAGGCFWGLEYFFEKLPGVKRTTVGFMGGQVVDPTYEEVCSGLTGHLEAIEVVFDPSQCGYEALARLFFEIHDPTQQDGQGPDLGPQYLSALFYLTQDQRMIGSQLLQQLKKKGLSVATALRPASRFYAADAHHQNYYQKNGHTPYCHRRISRF